MNSQVHVIYPMRGMAGSSAIPSQSLTVSTAAVSPTGFTSGAISSSGATMVFFDVQGVAVRTRADGTNPTSSVGHYLAAGTSYTWDVQRYNSSVFIRDTGAATDATIFASALQC